MGNRIPKDYVEKVYAGWLGKVIGVRHGSNIECWEYDKIRKVYGEITGYLFDFKNFAADDDTNGPYFFIRALEDETHTRDITPQQIARAWLNYAPYEHGFYWWGGYGISTEHTAYLNLRAGIEAPRSGQIEQNGAAVARQIGGQIFIDSWGLVIPCDYHLAAEYAKKAASVSHDSDGIYGGMFVAACVSAAFDNDRIEDILACGFEVIPKDCEYAVMGRDVLSFYQDNQDDWRLCFEFVREKYGYQHYPGNCHIIPNAAVMFLSMIYGQGDFSKTINICNMCGWDTDCNVGNVATILGVMVGLCGIDESWKKPINDLLINSSVVGSLNIHNVASGAYYLAGLGYKVAGEEVPLRWQESLKKGERCYDFELPGATHSFRAAVGAQVGCSDLAVSNTRETAFIGERSLKVSGKLYEKSDELNIYIQTHYRPEDFDDNRYDPCFSPLVYPGQTISCAVQLGEVSEQEVLACLYVYDDNTQKAIRGEVVKLEPGKWQSFKWDIPAGSGMCLSQAGVKLIGYGGAGGVMPNTIVAYIDDFVIEGEANYTVDFACERNENWTFAHNEVSQFTKLKGIWEIQDNKLYGSCSDYAESYTGLPAWQNYTVSTSMTPIVGASHRLLFRVQGGIRSYAVGLEKDGKIALLKNDNGYTTLIDVDYDWKCGETYKVQAALCGEVITIMVGDCEIIKYTDKEATYLKGQVGFGVYSGSRCCFENLEVKPTK